MFNFPLMFLIAAGHSDESSILNGPSNPCITWAGRISATTSPVSKSFSAGPDGGLLNLLKSATHFDNLHVGLDLNSRGKQRASYRQIPRALPRERHLDLHRKGNAAGRVEQRDQQPARNFAAGRLRRSIKLAGNRRRL